MNDALAPAKQRINSIDTLRGIIMIIMALDHVRDFFHMGAMTSDPTDPFTTTPTLFFTRWITHFCAPLFVFLAGTSIFLTGRKRSKKNLSVFLLKRGLWLMLIELTVFNFLFSFDPMLHFIGLQVIWVTGVSMVLMAALIYLPVSALMILGLLIIGCHNLLDAFNSPKMPDTPVWWALLHQQYFTQYAPGRSFMVLYPLLPWPGIMILGYCLGSLYINGYDAAKRRRILVQVGVAAIIIFLTVRWINVYGDLRKWSTQETTTRTILSFLNVTKYPPSLMYICMTIGPGLIVLAWLEKIKAGWTHIVVIYGRVPMFYYLLHFFLIHFLCMIMFFVSGHTWSQAADGQMIFRTNDFGYSLGVVYLIWIGIVVALYPLCKRYSKYKATHDHWWLSYL
jgi:uncharacterized membrane protein